MRLRRLLVPAVLVALTAATGHAGAVTKSCKLLKDDSGDGRSNNVSAVESPALDILSGDVATGKTEMVAVLRLGSTNTTSDNYAFLAGMNWALGVKLNGTDYLFKAEMPPLGTTWRKSVTVGDAAVAIKQFTVDGSSFTWKIDRSALKTLNVKPGQSFNQFHAVSNWNGSTADTALMPPTVKYKDRSLSCVVAK